MKKKQDSGGPRMATREEKRAMTPEQLQAYMLENRREIERLRALRAAGPTLEELQEESARDEERMDALRREAAADAGGSDENPESVRTLNERAGDVAVALGGMLLRPLKRKMYGMLERKEQRDRDAESGYEGDGEAAFREREMNLATMLAEVREDRDTVMQAWQAHLVQKPATYLDRQRNQQIEAYLPTIEAEYLQEEGRALDEMTPTYERLAVLEKMTSWLFTEHQMATNDPEFLRLVQRDGGERNDTLSRLRDIREGVEVLRNKVAIFRILVSQAYRHKVIDALKHHQFIKQINEDFEAQLEQMHDDAVYPTTQEKLQWVEEEAAYLDEEIQRNTEQLESAVGKGAAGVV